MEILLSAIFESSMVDVGSVLVLFCTKTAQREGSEVAYYGKDVGEQIWSEDGKSTRDERITKN